MDMLAKHMIDLVEAIRESYEKGRYMPCLVLLYSGMDVAASLETSNGSSVGSRFEYWVERYMLNGRTLNCSARDLYAARCAVVHTFTPRMVRRELSATHSGQPKWRSWTKRVSFSGGQDR
jgi:phage gp37-like protein